MKNGGDGVSGENHSKKGSSGDSPLSRKVKEAYASMCREGISELEIREDGAVVYLKRACAAIAPASAVSGGNPPVAAPPPAAAFKNIASPISGVFYRSASPKSPPFVSEGDTVEAGKTLCIVEAMKVMNEIKADSRARVVKILVDNGATVAQGQPLFAVD